MVGMQYRRLGRTSKDVSVIGFGCMKLPEKDLFGVSPDIFRAIEFASSAHDGSYRYGKPFIRHPVGAAFLLQ